MKKQLFITTVIILSMAVSSLYAGGNVNTPFTVQKPQGEQYSCSSDVSISDTDGAVVLNFETATGSTLIKVKNQDGETVIADFVFAWAAETSVIIPVDEIETGQYTVEVSYGEYVLESEIIVEN
ncbi:MAG: hypothetical protein LBN23_04840 [Paludibacter sp.]|jgi:hypothetical protein|nr:hypothetical protein [Paludibacter sp.]